MCSMHVPRINDWIELSGVTHRYNDSNSLYLFALMEFTVSFLPHRLRRLFFANADR